LNYKIFQICFEDRQIPLVDPLLTPFDNTSNERPELREFHSFNRIIDEGHVDDLDAWGVFGPRWQSKMRYGASEIKKSIDENPINPGGLAKVKDANGQKKIAEAEGHMDVARVYDGIAVATGGITLIQLSQGGAGSILKPGVLEALQLTVTSMPAQNDNAKKFDDMLKSYMAENKIPALSSGEKTALAKKTDPNAAKQASSF